MPVDPHLGFTKSGLKVSYRASPEPQKLAITAVLSETNQLLAKQMFNLVNCINAGAGSGAEFAPAASTAKILKGPQNAKDRGGPGPKFAWDLEVASVSPYFMRRLVEAAGNSDTCETLTIQGALPVDTTPLSVTEAKLRGWLEDKTSFVGEWASPGFPVKQKSIPRGASVEVTLEKALDDDLNEALTSWVDDWMLTMGSYPSLSGKMFGTMSTFPAYARKKRVWIARYEEFDIVVAPGRSVLVNVLARFHAQVAPIEKVELGFPT